MSNCRGCDNVLDPTESEVNQGVSEILEASLQDAVEHGEIVLSAAAASNLRLHAASD
jgi:hypothetical protein